MNILQLITSIGTVALNLPWENFLIKPNNEKSEQIRKEVMEIAATQSVQVATTPAPILTTATAIAERPTRNLEETIQREQEGDYCLACVPSKHWQRALDALVDAKNIIDSKGTCTEVAEDKIQQAVLQLNGAEVDLEKAVVSDTIKPAVKQMHTRNREVRSFLRADHSGLELCTMQTDKEAILKNLDLVINNLGVMIKDGYAVSKQHFIERVQELAEAKGE
jgi:hypothetical protein